MFDDRRVSQSFVRNFRKSYLLADGTPEPGKEELCETLMHVVRALQSGSYNYAIAYAWQRGIDLNTMYTEYVALVRTSKVLGNTWRHFERWCAMNVSPRKGAEILRTNHYGM